MRFLTCKWLDTIPINKVAHQADNVMAYKSESISERKIIEPGYYASGSAIDTDYNHAILLPSCAFFVRTLASNYAGRDAEVRSPYGPGFVSQAMNVRKVKLCAPENALTAIDQALSCSSALSWRSRYKTKLTLYTASKTMCLQGRNCFFRRESCSTTHPK